jgi:hypothetical protein
MSYRVRRSFSIDCGFRVRAADVLGAATLTNKILADLPSSLYRSVDFKTTSAIVGSILCEHLAAGTNSIVNPIEKGHPDILPKRARNSTEAELRNYPFGLEIKSTIGNVAQGANLRAGVRRVQQMVGITWQAHHRNVAQLMGVTWDFVQAHESFGYPGITGVFYSDNLREEDWGEISGTTGRNTKVSGMRTSGKRKMGAGWILLWKEIEYLEMFQRTLPAIVLPD